MRFCLLSSLFSCIAVATAFDQLGGSYTPTTQVREYAALDLDQNEIRLQLSNNKSNMPAFHVYQNGGYSGSYAVLTLLNLGEEASSYPAGTAVYGQTFSGTQTVGYLAEDTSWPKNTDEKEIQVTYTTGDVPDPSLDCHVGGLWHFSQEVRRGCFNDAGVITLALEGEDPTTSTEYEYVYDTLRDNRNQNTLQKLSTDAGSTMTMPVSKEYFSEFQAFVDYYGDTDYGDKWVAAAHNKEATSFSKDRGQADFTVFEESMGSNEAMKNGIVGLNIWMQVVRHITAAVELCGTPDAAAELDKAVALYAGSLTSDPADEKSGILLYELANVRSHQFKTAGDAGDMESGTAHTNVQIMSGFQELQAAIVNAPASSKCGAAVTDIKETIIDYMKVPLIQSVIRYAYVRDNDIRDFDLDNTERTMAESATFSAAILPLVHQCSPSAARTLYDHTKIHASKTDFNAVQNALEKTYKCLNVSCELVGGVWDREEQAYHKGGEPCEGVRVERIRAGSGAIARFFKGLFKFMAYSFLVGVLAFAGYKYRHNVRRHFARFVQRKQATTLPPPPPPSNYADNINIAAVTEIW